jgi:hypothetical protein
MRTARSVRPTDLVALVSFDGRVYPNESHTWDRLGRQSEGPRLLENAFEQWFSFATGRHTWISVQGQTIRGVISARPRGSRLAWEIDCLIVADEDEEAVLLALLDQANAAAVQARVLRVFLRVEAGSDLLAPVRKAGFMPLVVERLYRLTGSAPETSPDPSLQLRERGRTDGFTLFRLYNLVTPVSVRELEAATYAEWIAGQEKRSQGRGKLDVVVERGGEIVGWLRAVPDGGVGRLDLLLHPDAAAYGPGLLAHAVSWLGNRRPLYCLVPAYATGLASMLEEGGFDLAGEYISLVKRLALPLREPAPTRVPAHHPIVPA